MINLQSHNQVLYHLTQFTSSITPRSSSLVVKVKKQNNSEGKNTEGILCKDSFQEAVKSFNELGIDKIDIENLTTPLRLRKNDVWEILEHLYKKESSDVVRNINSWKVSYISGANFNENKRGFPFSQLSQTTLPAIQLYIGTQRRFFHKFGLLKIHSDKAQIRFFKTDQSIKAELKRNPTLSTRIQKWIGLNTQRDNYMERLPGNVSTTSAAIREHGDIDKLKKYQNDKYIRADELQRIKAAYSEGYQAGSEQKPQGKAYKAIKFMQQLMSTIVLVVIFIGVIASTGAGVFKIQLGEKVQIDPESVDVTFNDVKGIEESKSELMNVVEFLKNPDKFSALGGKLPKGVLLMGPPGTGKTLLARAVAGEAGVPFYHAAGPEFDEVFVGQGARRVRELFKAAKEHAPCVVFIDEIDSVGAKRTHSSLHPYANQTVNQLLSEMDGFHQNEGIIVLGATNRREDLDSALLRPGRFDAIITVHKPDVIGREDIINLYLVKILTRDIDVAKLAQNTVGFTGADLQNMINQAALIAALDSAEYVTMEHFEQAIDKVTMGPETKSRVNTMEDIRITAYHEAGHALVAHYTANSPPVHKVSVVARGPVLGYTKRLDKDIIHQSKGNLLANMDVCMGGRAAEELIFGPDKVTTGSTRDFMSATDIAEAMVWKLGMSEKVGVRVHNEKRLVNGMYSTNTKELIDDEVKRLLKESYDRAMSILKHHSQEHKLIAETLIKYETLNGEDIQLLLKGDKSRFEARKKNEKREIIGMPKNVM